MSNNYDYIQCDEYEDDSAAWHHHNEILYMVNEDYPEDD